MDSLKQYLDTQKLLDKVAVPTQIAVLLNGLQIVENPAQSAGHVVAGINTRPLFLDFALKPGGPQLPYKLTTSATGFSLVLDFTQAAGADSLLTLLGSVATNVLVAAQEKTEPATGTDSGGQLHAPNVWLEALPPVPPSADPPAAKITKLGVAIVIDATFGGAAAMRISPSPDQPEGLVAVGLDPQTVLLGTTGFGLKLSGDMVLDLSATAATDVPAVVDGKTLTMPSAVPGWKGLTIHKARFYLPERAPIFGKTACDVALDIGFSPPGISMAVSAHAPERDGVPAMDIRIECIDPTATGLSSLAPTLVEAAVTLPIAGDQKLGPDGGGNPGSVKLLAGSPVIARARFSRDPTDPDHLTRLSVALEAQGKDGIMAVRPQNDGDTFAIALIGAAGLATALIADNKLGGTNGHGGTIAALLVAGQVLSAILSPKGALVVNRVELDTAGHGLPVGEPLVFLVDYSVDVPIKPVDIGVLSIKLKDERLLRIRMRGVKLSYDPKKSGLSAVALDFEHATMDVEDPGDWEVQGPGSLFDVLGTRSGKGSIWLEIDLRFKLDLGPIKVSGATIRATLDNGNVSVSLRGLDVTLSIPALVSAEGKIALDAPSDANNQQGGFSARLAAKILPLKVAADAWISVDKPKVLIGLDVDLPGPIPLGATGLGLFGLGGMIGISAAITIPPNDKGPIAAQLEWKPDKNGFAKAPGQFTFGAQAVIGTLPDLGFDFAAKAGLFLTLPDLAVLGSLDARFMSGPISLVDPPASDPNNSVRGTVSVLPATGTQFAIEGRFGVPHLVTAKVPVAGSFPNGADSANWYVYIGSDGVEDGKGRGIGPIKMVVLPDLFPQTADAYLMLRGNGLSNWRGGLTIPSGFVIAFGFGMEMTFGPKPVVWAEVNGGVDVMVATGPLVIAGFGHIDGSIHIGPVSLGVSAQLTVCLTDNSTYVLAEVCGRIHLLFVTIHKCAKLSFGGQVTPTVPPPAISPIDRTSQDAQGNRIVTGKEVSLVDDKYRLLADLSDSAGTTHIVWPDTLIRIGFGWAPALGTGALSQFKATYADGTPAKPIGSDFLSYEWTITKINLFDETTGIAVAGELSATWQSGKAGDSSEVAQAAELILLSPQGDLWIDRLSDPASSKPADPKGPAATCCQATVAVKPGWALATSIKKIMQPTWLPPEIVSADPTQSRVSGVMAWAMETGGGLSAIESLFGALPPGVAFIPPIPLAVPETFGPRAFGGLLTLPFLKFAPAAANAQLPALPKWFTATILLDDPLTGDGTLQDPAAPHGVLVAMCLDPTTWVSFQRASALRVADPLGDWTPAPFPLPSGQLGIVFTMPAGRKAPRVTIRWRSDGHFAFLGLGGVTVKAAAAAKAKQDALNAQADKNKQTAGTDPGDAANNAAQRCLLQPGHRYRVDIAMSWRGTVYKQGDNGQKVQAAPPQTGDWPVQQFWFNTAPDPHLPGASSVPLALPKTGSGQEMTLYTQQDGFAPEMLVRHLAAYEPAQSVVDRFRNDPLRVHFDVGHVARLAKLYGYDLALALRRTDVAGPGGNLQLQAWKLKSPTTGDFLKGAARAHYDLAKQSTCPVPVEGGTMDAPVQLEARAWYETFVRMTHPTAPKADLAGVTFRTSRWTDATDMLAGLHFPVSGSGQASGDVALTKPASGVVAGTSDTAFDAALLALGLEGWPVPAAPRASLLWALMPDQKSWGVAGLLLDSPEPIERPGRTGPATLSPRLAPDQAAVTFTTKVSDRTGSRLLWLASSPFVPAAWSTGPSRPPLPGPGKLPIPGPGPIILKRFPQLVLTMPDITMDRAKGMPVPTLTGFLSLPIAPLFAGEAY